LNDPTSSAPRRDACRIARHAERGAFASRYLGCASALLSDDSGSPAAEIEETAMNPMTMRVAPRLMMEEIERELEQPRGKVRRPRPERASTRRLSRTRRPFAARLAIGREEAPPTA
jgi:hypothetical protein